MAMLNKMMYLNPVPFVNKADDEAMQMISVEYIVKSSETGETELRTFGAYIVTPNDTITAADCVQLVKDRIRDITHGDDAKLFAIYMSTNPDADYDLAACGYANCPEDSAEAYQFMEDFKLFYWPKALTVDIEYAGDITGKSDHLIITINDASGITDKRIIKAAKRLVPNKDAVISVSRSVVPGEECVHDPRHLKKIYDVYGDRLASVTA